MAHHTVVKQYKIASLIAKPAQLEMSNTVLINQKKN